MKTHPTRTTLNRDHAGLTRRISTSLFIAFQAALIGLSGVVATGQAQEPRVGVRAAEILTRGPVHEAFAGIVSFNPEPGIIVETAPPEAIEELPPEERPEGDNITWIPGYWAWDDERTEFLWISGTWRALPPGREWISGYWSPSPQQGHQWISGYWADSTAEETIYLPQPPQTVEIGANVIAPSPDYGWTPGCWVWHQERYAWSPGYWAQGRADWDWIPANYVWTPRGYVFVDGYWDYTVSRRGVLFAPVSFGASAHSHRGYRYSPSIAIDLGAFADNLFLRPHYHHYYFGDYYAPVYVERGFYPSHSFQSSRHGYDPVYSHQRWEHRHDRDWEQRNRSSHQYRRDHESARPPRTWTAQKGRKVDPNHTDPHRVSMATPFDQLAKRKDSHLRFQPTGKDERQRLAHRGQEIRKSRDDRRILERRAIAKIPGKAAQEIRPSKIKALRSPIVGKPPRRLPKELTPPMPQRRSIAKDQLKKQTTERKPGPSNLQPQREPRKPELQKEKMKPGKGKAEPSRPEPKRPTVKPQKSPQPLREPRKPETQKERTKPAKGKTEPSRPEPKRPTVKPQKSPPPPREPRKPETKKEKPKPGKGGAEPSRPGPKRPTVKPQKSPQPPPEPRKPETRKEKTKPRTGETSLTS